MNNLLKILKKPFICIGISVICGFIVVCGILAITGYNPWQCMAVMFNSIFSRPKFIVNVVIKSVPVILTGISVAFAFKSGLFNINAEGQYIISTVTTTILGILLNFHPAIQIPLLIICGFLSGALWGGFVGFLKAKFGIHEVITSIMLNWIALYFCNYISNSKMFHKPESDGTFSINESGFITILYNWKYSVDGRNFFKSNPFWSDVLLKTDLNFSILFVILTAIIVSIFLYRTSKGYELRAVGLNPEASERAGIDVKKNIFISMLISGGISGLAGAFNIMGTSFHNIHVLSIFENVGFNGLAIALIANNSPIGCIFSGLMFSGILYAGQSLQFKTGAPSEIVNILIGVIVFFVSLTKIVPIIIDKLAKRRIYNAK